ncbi:LOG family protein (plasmid) [Streptomyces sp. NBC_01387]|uniref:SLOG cluster 4 domain-containing protein n=1 Tax=unclassified Streptomyces TaxID=2593676 RepID=UPI002023E644|nr:MULTISPECIES: LOG family protein [unclassified Streptomyces]MCX4554438.1 LOG family protein [Streptomyces sp. NBC_01500]WSC25184.1 LOG family protein [Streptomyces sp. NBC_01766]
MTMAEVRPSTSTSEHRDKRAVFFGGVMPASAAEKHMAEQIGILLAASGFTLVHGGYNGLMEAAAHGAATKGGRICAVTLAAKCEEWGGFNPYVTEAVHLASLGDRLNHYFDQADLVVAMGGGVGTLHELTAALYYAGNIRPLPVLIAGPTALRLLDFLRREKWLFASPTRQLGFITEATDIAALAAALPAVTAGPKGGTS